MKRKLMVYAVASLGGCMGLAGALIGIFWGGAWKQIAPQPTPSPGVNIQPVAESGLQTELRKIIVSAPGRVMGQSGLVAVMGEVHAKVFSGDPQDILFPIPQLTDAQVPICFFISASPPDAAVEFRLRQREDCNAVATVRLKGKNQEVQIAWSSVVLIAPRNTNPSTAPADAYRTASPCVQSQADEITKLAANLWPRTGTGAEFAANIQRHIRESTRKEPPRSLDALEILRSGDNKICTGNANLAAALMRSRGIACRTVAAIPSNSQRLEMHRIVEFHENGQWLSFDPSSVYTDVPTKAWQYITMAQTTVGDEARAMKLRMGAMPGCPYGHEAELLTPGVSLFGREFFWTQANPLAEFEATEDAIRLAADAWARYLATGALTQGQLKAASAHTATAFGESLRNK